MTSHLPELHPTKDFLAPPEPKTRLFWLFPIALGALAGVGFAAWSLSGRQSAPEPPPSEFAPALAAVAPSETQPAGPSDPSAESDEAVESTTTVDDDSAAAYEPAPVQEVTDGVYVVQVASYRDEADAQNHVQALTSRELPTRRIHGGHWYKVQLGPFETRAEAEKGRFKLTLNERRAAYVLPRSNGKYHVQVGSFATLAEAEPIRKRLADKGHSTKISRIRMAGRRWHCVRIGPFDTYEEAEAYRALVDVTPGSQSRVIPFRPTEE